MLAVAPGGWFESACSYKNAAYEVATVTLLQNKPVFALARLQTKQKFEKRNQFGILAQFFWLCGNLRLEIFPRTPYSALVFASLSSAALVTAARKVQVVAQKA